MDADDAPMSKDLKGHEIDCDAGPAEWKVRIGTRNSPTLDSGTAGHVMLEGKTSTCETR